MSLASTGKPVHACCAFVALLAIPVFDRCQPYVVHLGPAAAGYTAPLAVVKVERAPVVEDLGIRRGSKDPPRAVRKEDD